MNRHLWTTVLSPGARLCGALLLTACLCATAGGFRAGVARERITPPMPFWLSGYAARTNPAAVVHSDLWTKALAIEDPQGHRLVIVTTDLIGLPAAISDAVAAKVQQQYRLPRRSLILSASHTHSGPVIWPNLRVLFDFDPRESARVEQYSRDLTASLVRVIGSALDRLDPADLAIGHASASFAVNRRERTTAGVRIGINPTGPVDHDVPVLRATGPDGRLLGVLFGYACHNTTLGGNSYQVDGDYAGAAQRALEAAHPGSTALFLQLCAGDQNPNPRGTLTNVTDHGGSLASAVERALAGTMRPLHPSVRTAQRSIHLDFATHTRADFARESTSPDVFRQRRARLMLEAYDAKRPVRRLSYPVQAARLGGSFTLLALGGEVVIGYALRAKAEFPGEDLLVAGYCHDVACYIPTRTVLREGGYEPVDSMIYYGQPGPLADTVEEDIFAGIRGVMRKVGVKAR